LEEEEEEEEEEEGWKQYPSLSAVTVGQVLY